MIACLLTLIAVLMLVVCLVVIGVALDLGWRGTRALHRSWRAAAAVIAQTEAELSSQPADPVDPGSDPDAPVPHQLTDAALTALADAVQCGWCDQHDFGADCSCGIRCAFRFCLGRSTTATWTKHDFGWLQDYGITFRGRTKP